MSQSVDELYSVYTETERHARKAHTCDACGDPILPRHRYFRISWVFDGSADSVKRCLGCQATHVHLRKLGREDDMWPSETLSCGEEYMEHWGKPPPPHIARLAFASPDEKQALVFRVFRNHRGDHFIAETLSEAEALAGVTGPFTEVQNDVGVPIVVDGEARFFHRYPADYHETFTLLYQAGYVELKQQYDLRSSQEWAVEYGRGLLCSGDALPAQQGPLKKREMWG